MIVDDSPLVRSRLAELVAEVENVRVAGQSGTVADALAALPRLHPDFVIIDIAMPDGNGITVLEAAKHLQHAPLVGMLTHYPFPQFRKRCLEAGADFFWDKGRDLAEIPAVLRGLAGEPRR